MLLTANIFQPLIDVFQQVLSFFHGLGFSWGFSIVLLTICVRVVLLPLTVKQFGSMRRMQHLQPQMKAIQQKYKEDKQRQQEEMMKFYRENDVNPLGSCLPLVAQLPVFISLFYMLRKNLRTDICPGIQHVHQLSLISHGMSAAAAKASAPIACGPVPAAHFLFIDDITNTAHGATLVILLVLYVGTQVLSTMLMSAPTMDKTQRRMMMLMPLIFVFFVIRFPAGLIVYWITTNTWTMAQQYTLKRMMGPPPAPVVDVATGGPAGGGGGSGGSMRGRGSGGTSDGGRDSDGSSGSGSGGLGGFLSGARARATGSSAVAGSSSGNSGSSGGSAESSTPAVPPPPPRKKKKRSGRRR
jgi:YidC/Oxa1 family membrane protein insertase